MKLPSPFAFTPGPVTFITTLIYIVIITLLLIQHFYLPSPKGITGVDLDEAWRDLQTLTSAFHPYNSHRNDEVRSWLLSRIEDIVASNRDRDVRVRGSTKEGVVGGYAVNVPWTERRVQGAPVTVFAKDDSNVSVALPPTIRRNSFSSYFESTNVIVYIRGRDDDATDWWTDVDKYPAERNGVLVNAHFDSVSTGYGATDDGVGVVTVLQLIKYFSAPGRQPKNGIVALINNGEEDLLYGARAFLKHPMSKLPATFLNLEGAGAGGRATLFRSTDTEVTRAYKQAPHPFGSVVSADAFKRGLIKSETDYRVFNAVGWRGLDVAFFEPRARYHTPEDDTKHTNKASLYHMLSASVATMQELSDVTDDLTKSDDGKGSDGVWFDLFGRAFAVFKLHTLFALSVTLVVLIPVVLIAVLVLLKRNDRMYLFSGAQKASDGADGDDSAVSIKGKRGIFRWTIAFILATAALIVSVWLIYKINPFIVYSSPYAVWSMMISVWISVAYLSLGIADRFRPTALQRLYTFLWMLLVDWLLLIAAIVVEQQAKLGGAYIVFFYVASVFLATLICLLELFGAPSMTEYASSNPEQRRASEAGLGSSNPPIDQGRQGNEDEDADETAPLIRGPSSGSRTFKHYRSAHARSEAEDEVDSGDKKVWGQEQPWSSSMPSFLWLLEFILVAPFPFIILGQLGLLLTSALPQTLADGSSPLIVYAAFGALAILLFSPIGPFLHRFSSSIPLFLFLVFIGTLLYNLFAFPFSPNNRLKIYFQQRIDVDSRHNNVSLIGIGDGKYLDQIAKSIPSAADSAQVRCNASSSRENLKECKYPGPRPNPVPGVPDPQDWFTANFTLLNAGNTTSDTYRAAFNISAQNSRACKILFDTPITDFSVLSTGSGPVDPPTPLGEKSPESGIYLPKTFEDGSKDLRLWSRTWPGSWEGWFEWLSYPSSKSDRNDISYSPTNPEYDDDDKDMHTELKNKRDRENKMTGQVMCLYSDANDVQSTIPALAEVWHYVPNWVAVSKEDDGLVEAYRHFVI